jgi:CoA:oxalate CoA-transferase
VDIVISANTEGMWQGMCRALGLTALCDDARFRTNKDRHRNREALAPLLEEAFTTRPALEWVALLEREEVPVGVVNTLDRVADDAQLRHRDMVLELSAPDGRHARVMGNPIKFAASPDEPRRFPPALGEDTKTVLRDVLGLDDGAVETLVASGAVVAR